MNNNGVLLVVSAPSGCGKDTIIAEALKAYFAANAKGLLEKGVKINEVKGIKTDFAIVPEKGGYKLNFGEKEFVEYFKEFLRPQLIDLLF